MLTILALTAEASPTILRPINPQNQPKGLITVRAIRPVTLAGYVVESGNITPTVSVRVVDEYGRNQPSKMLPAQLISGVDPMTQQPLTPATFF